MEDVKVVVLGNLAWEVIDIAEKVWVKVVVRGRSVVLKAALGIMVDCRLIVLNALCSTVSQNSTCVERSSSYLRLGT